jgi:hypothetical protein
MADMVLSLMSAILIGLGATLTFDLWALFLKYAFKITPSNICLVGRWLRYMLKGTFTHVNIVSSPPKAAECVVGWVAHYVIGMTFSIVFVALAGSDWLLHPTLVPPVIFGIVTVLGPFLIMHPSMGFGWAASKTSHPAQARIRSVMNHAAFGVGLYLFALLLNWLQQVDG